MPRERVPWEMEVLSRKHRHAKMSPGSGPPTGPGNRRGGEAPPGSAGHPGPLPALAAPVPWYQRPGTIALFLAVLTILPYLQVPWQSFVLYDDESVLYNNPFINHGLSWQGLAYAFRIHGPSEYNPFAWISHMIDFSLFGLWAGGHKLHSLLLHVGVTVLWFTLLYRMTGKLWRSALVAAFFGVHPLRVEVVAWVSERKELLANFWGILTLLAYVHYTKKPGLWRYLLVFGLFTVAMGCKPVVVTLPAVMVLLDYWPLRRFNGLSKAPDILRFIALVCEKIPLLLPALVGTYLTVLCQIMAGAVDKATLGTYPFRIANALVAYGAYIITTVVPVWLTYLYQAQNHWPLWRLVAGAAVLVVGTWLALRFGKDRRYLRVGWFWFIGTLLPTIGLVPVGMQAYDDRYTYFPIVGLLILGVWGVADLLERYPIRRPLLYTSLGAYLAVLVVASWIQVGFWSNTFTLFFHNVEMEPNSPLARTHLAYAWLVSGHTEAALKEGARAQELDLNFWPSNQVMAQILFTRHQYAQAEPYLCRLLVTGGVDYRTVSAMLALSLADAGQGEAALRLLRPLMERWPSPNLYLGYGLAYQRMGKPQEALKNYERALAGNPRNAEAERLLGLLLIRMGRQPEGLKHLERAVALDPTDPVMQGTLSRYLPATRR